MAPQALKRIKTRLVLEKIVELEHPGYRRSRLPAD